MVGSAIIFKRWASLFLKQFIVYKISQTMRTSLEKSMSALKSGRSTDYILLDRENLNLDFAT